jgi:hypothetical protein
MLKLPAYLIAASAAILLVLGSLHLLYTFHGPNLRPRDAGLQARMGEVSPVISRETTMWKTWIGFNATHSLGLILFGLVYGYLALLRPDWLFGSIFLLAVGGVLIAAYAFISMRYFFSVPFGSLVLALVLYVLAAGQVISRHGS